MWWCVMYLTVCFRVLMPLLIEIRFTTLWWWNCFSTSFAFSAFSAQTCGLPQFYPSFPPFRPVTLHWLRFRLPTCVVVFLDSRFGQGIPKYASIEIIARPGHHMVAQTLELCVYFCVWVHATICVVVCVCGGIMLGAFLSLCMYNIIGTVASSIIMLMIVQVTLFVLVSLEMILW